MVTGPWGQFLAGVLGLAALIGIRLWISWGLRQQGKK